MKQVNKDNKMTKTKGNKRVARALRVAMFKYGELSGVQFAEKYGCSKAYASLVRNNGADSLKTVEKMADVFGLGMMEFLELGDQ